MDSLDQYFCLCNNWWLCYSGVLLLFTPYEVLANNILVLAAENASNKEIHSRFQMQSKSDKENSKTEADDKTGSGCYKTRTSCYSNIDGNCFQIFWMAVEIGYWWCRGIILTLSGALQTAVWAELRATTALYVFTSYY